MRELKHPFGFLDGDSVVPAEVEDGETAECPLDGCDEQLHVRGPSVNGTVRHFWHPGSGGGGSGGSHGGGGVAESATHKNYKSHAASALLNFFDGFIEESTTKEVFEQRVEIPDTDRYRQADTRVTLESPHPKFGKGIIIEVQHENRDKDIDAVTEDYLAAEYSVWWTDSETHYEPGGYLFDRDQLEAETITVWPNAVPGAGEWNKPWYELGLITNRARRWRHEYTTDAFGNIKSAPQQWDPSRPYTFAGREFGVEFDRPYYSTTVQFPREFYEDYARESFRQTAWNELFPGYEWEARTSFPEPDNGAKRNEYTDAFVHEVWFYEPEESTERTIEASIFRETPWSELFSGYEYRAGYALNQLWDEYSASVPATFPIEVAYESVDEMVRDERRQELDRLFDSRTIPHPGHSQDVAKRCMLDSCAPGEHDWVELTGASAADWRECRVCGVNEPTWDAIRRLARLDSGKSGGSREMVA